MSTWCGILIVGNTDFKTINQDYFFFFYWKVKIVFQSHLVFFRNAGKALESICLARLFSICQKTFADVFSSFGFVRV